jgi:hypothetical protein
VSSPAGIRASIPQQGQLLTFHRAVAVEAWADLKIGLQATMAATAPMGMRVLMLAGVLLVFAILGSALSRFVTRTEGSR